MLEIMNSLLVVVYKSCHDKYLFTFVAFTYQYLQLNALIETVNRMTNGYSLSVVGFPCNQFAHQEPADNKTELYKGLKFVRPGDGYVPKFTLMKKIDVNGENETSLYAYLKVYLSIIN